MPQPIPDYEWLIMLYLSGDNNLSAEMVRAIKEIETVGLPEGVALTIQYDALSPCCKTLRYALPAKRGLRAPNHAGTLLLRGADIEEIADDNSADPTVLGAFIRDSARLFPSKSRMLILSGHGSGAVGDFLTDVSARQRQAGSMSIRQLRRALELAGLPKEPLPIDILGMDSCLMSMAEVCFEIRDYVHFLAGSEGFVPNAGWPYGHLFHNLRANPIKGGPDAAASVTTRIVEDYVGFYKDFLSASVSVDMAGIDLTQLDSLRDALKTLSDELKKSVSDHTVQNLILVAHWRSQSFKLEQYTDLWDFCDQLQKETEKAGGADATLKRIATACDGVKAAIEHVVGDRQRFSGIEFQHTHGLSVYFPWSRPAYTDQDYLRTYSALEFPKTSHWNKFLLKYLDSTMREARGQTEAEKVERLHSPDHRPADFFPAHGELFRSGTKKYAADYNKYAADYNKFLIEQLNGMLPGSMKNPPQGVILRPRRALGASPGGPPPPSPSVQVSGSAGSVPAPHALSRTLPIAARKAISDLTAVRSVKKGGANHGRGRRP